MKTNQRQSIQFQRESRRRASRNSFRLNALNITSDIKSIRETLRKKDSVPMNDPEFQFHINTDSTFVQRFMGNYEMFNLLPNKEKIKTFSEASEKYSIENNWENRAAFNTASSIIKFTRQPGSFFNDMISKFPFATFFLLPIFSIFIWLAYIRKKYTYTDHLIFSFHNQSLLFILLIISFLFDSIFSIESGWIFISIFSIYLFQSMRKFYGQGAFKTIVKYLFLNTIFFILAGISVFLLFTGSLFTY